MKKSDKSYHFYLSWCCNSAVLSFLILKSVSAMLKVLVKQQVMQEGGVKA